MLARKQTSLEEGGARADSGPVVEVLSAEKIFANGTRALAPIDLTIADGEFLTLIGPSGCGKSTLLKLIANLLEPSDGRILWWRGPFDKVGSAGRSLSFVFQDPTLMPWARVDANVRLPLDLAGKPKAESRQRVAEAHCPRRARRFRARLSAPVVRRHADARVDRAQPRHRAQPAADGRAVRRARRVHPQPARCRPHQAVVGAQAHHGVRHPFDL